MGCVRDAFGADILSHALISIREAVALQHIEASSMEKTQRLRPMTHSTAKLDVELPSTDVLDAPQQSGGKRQRKRPRSLDDYEDGAFLDGGSGNGRPSRASK